MKSKATREVRETACVLAKAANLKYLSPPVEVTLHYQPRDKRRRDADNLVAPLKALCDGLVDAGVVEDDTPEYMMKMMPVIHPPIPGDPGRMWMTIIERNKQ